MLTDLHQVPISFRTTLPGINCRPDTYDHNVAQIGESIQLFDGYFFEIHIPIGFSGDDKRLDPNDLTIQEQVIVKVPPTEKHPDNVTPIVLPKNWKLDFTTTFNGLEYFMPLNYIYKVVDTTGRPFFYCEVVKKGKGRRSVKGSFNMIKNYVKSHRTVPISIKTLKEFKDKGIKVYAIKEDGATVRLMIGNKKKVS